MINHKNSKYHIRILPKILEKNIKLVGKLGNSNEKFL